MTSGSGGTLFSAMHENPHIGHYVGVKGTEGTANEEKRLFFFILEENFSSGGVCTVILRK